MDATKTTDAGLIIPLAVSVMTGDGAKVFMVRKSADGCPGIVARDGAAEDEILDAEYQLAMEIDYQRRARSLHPDA